MTTGGCWLIVLILMGIGDNVAGTPFELELKRVNPWLEKGEPDKALALVFGLWRRRRRSSPELVATILARSLARRWSAAKYGG